jgi:hypothetical protein
VDDERNMLGTCREICGRRGIPAEPDNDVDLPVVDYPPGTPHQSPQCRGKAEGGAADSAWGGKLVDRDQLEAPLRYETTLQPLFRAEHKDRCGRIVLAESICHGEQRIHMASGSTTGEEVRGHDCGRDR